MKSVLSVLYKWKSLSSALLFGPWKRLREWETAFKLHYWKVRHAQALTPQEQAEYDEIIYVMDLSTLYEWTAHVLAVAERESKDVEARKPGLLSLFWGSSSQEAADYEALIRDLDYREDCDPLIPPTDYNWLQLSFHMAVCVLTLVKSKPGNLTEGLTVCNEGTAIELQLASESSAIEISLRDTKGEAWERSDGHEDVMPFYRRSAQSDGNILQITHTSFPPASGIRSQTRIHTEPVEIIYSPKVLERIASFLIHIQTQQAVKTAALDKLQYIQVSTNQKISKVLQSPEKRVIELDLSAPVLIVRANSTEEFRLSLGRFQIANRAENDSEMYEEMMVTVTDVKLVHTRQSSSYPILQPVAFSLSAKFLNNINRASKRLLQPTELDRFADMELSARLETVQCNLTYHVYRLLLETLEHIKAEEDALAALSMDKRSIMKSAVAFDIVSKEGFKGWFSYFCVLSQDYLYFFNSPTETSASTYFHLKECTLACEVQDCERWVMRLRSKLGDCVVGFQSKEQMEKWRKLVINTISNLETLISKAANHPESPETRRTLTEKVSSKVDVELSQVRISLTDDVLDAWFNLTIMEISVGAVSAPFRSKFEARLRHLEATDRRIESSEQFYTLVKSMDVEQGLIDMSLVAMDALHPDFQGVEAKCDVRFHRICISWNQETLVDLLNFLTFQPSRQEAAQPVAAIKCCQAGNIELQLSLHFDKVDLLLNNVQSELSIAKVSVEEFDVSLESYPCRTNISGNLGNISLFDLTEYPRTALKKYVDNPVPFCLFSLREGLQQLLQFSIQVFKRGCKEIEGDVDTVLSFHLSSVKFVYLHQPVMRIIDFFMNKILIIFDKQ